MNRFTSPRRGEVDERSEAGEGESADQRTTHSPLTRPAADLSPPGWGETPPFPVMAGLVPAIHDLNTAGARDVVDARREAGHDGWGGG